VARRANAREKRLRARPRWRDNDARSQRAPGIGPVGARPVRRALPALGTRTRQHRAAWVGVAPLHGNRGPLRGRRIIWGGRAPGRPMLSMGPRGASRDHPRMQAFDARRLAAGTVTTVAVTAGRQTLWTIRNARLKQRTPWHAQEVQGEKISQAPLTTKTVAPLLRRYGFQARLSASVRLPPYSPYAAGNLASADGVSYDAHKRRRRDDAEKTWVCSAYTGLNREKLSYGVT